MNKHGHSNTGKLSPTYNTWISMRQRCLNKKSSKYKNWGGRGIKICDKWKSFKVFLEDMGERPSGKCIERINNNKGYNKKNCKWATQKEQMQNTRRTKKVGGISISEFSKINKLEEYLVRSRIYAGWSKNEILKGERKRKTKYNYGDFKNAVEVANYFGIHRVRVYQKFWEGWKIIGKKFIKSYETKT